MGKSKASESNPLLRPLLDTFDVKRNAKTGLIPPNWLLIVLCVLDRIRDADEALHEDEVYTYDYSLKDSRATAIVKLLARYGLPRNLGISSEGVTVRGAPALRMFRAMSGGGIIMGRTKEERVALVLEAVEVVREEVMKVLGQNPVSLPSNIFERSGKFVVELLAAVENRSQGRVEQALVGAKLQLRFPNASIPSNPGFAADKQTGREADFQIDDIRVIVSVTPKPQHFASAKALCDENKEVYLVVSEVALSSAKKRMQQDGYEGDVTVLSVADYVASNMKEIARDLKINAHEMCMRLVAEYNRRIAFDNNHSLQVVVPTKSKRMSS